MAQLQQLSLTVQASEQAAASARTLRCMHCWSGPDNQEKTAALRAPFDQLLVLMAVIYFVLVRRPAAAPRPVELFSLLHVAWRRGRFWPALR